MFLVCREMTSDFLQRVGFQHVPRPSKVNKDVA